MVRREIYRAMEPVLEAMASEPLEAAGFALGRATRIALAFGEVCESADLDFVGSDARRYAELRWAVRNRGTILGTDGARRSLCYALPARMCAVVDPASMLKGRTRETKIRRDAEGRWFNDQVELTHVLLRQAFDRWLGWAPDGSGRYCLANDINWAYVAIEGAPRFVRTVSVEDGEFRLRLSDEREVALARDTLRQGPDGALYCDVSGGLVARFDRHAMMQLAQWIEEDERGVHLAIGDEVLRPCVVEDPLR